MMPEVGYRNAGNMTYAQAPKLITTKMHLVEAY